MAVASASKSKDAGTKPKSAASPKSAAHPTYEDMVKAAILTLKDRKGSSRQAIKKYIAANFQNLGEQYEGQITAAIKRGVDKGIFTFPKGPSGSVKLTKPTKPTPSEAKSTTPKNKATAKAAPAKPAATKAASPKSSTTTQKAASKKPKAVKKPAAAKKTAVKTKTAAAKKTSSKKKAVTKKA